MANTKWTLYKIVDGEERKVTGGTLDTFVYAFPSNVTDVVENYIVRYEDGDIKPEELRHNVLTDSSCVTQPTKCNCEKIGFTDSQDTVRIAYTKNSSGTKKCFSRNNCPIYYKVEYPSYGGNDNNWLNVNLDGVNLGFTAKSDSFQERRAIISIYYDEDKQNKCDSFTVIQEAKNKVRIKWEIALLTKGYLKTVAEKVSLRNIYIKLNDSVLNSNKHSLSGDTKVNGYVSGVTDVNNDTIPNLIASLSFDDTQASGSYLRTLHVGMNLEPFYFDDRYTSFRNTKGTGTIPSETMYCERNNPENGVCVCAYKYIGIPSDYTGQTQINTSDADILIRYEITPGGCVIT